MACNHGGIAYLLQLGVTLHAVERWIGGYTRRLRRCPTVDVLVIWDGRVQRGGRLMTGIRFRAHHFRISGECVGAVFALLDLGGRDKRAWRCIGIVRAAAAAVVSDCGSSAIVLLTNLV